MILSSLPAAKYRGLSEGGTESAASAEALSVICGLQCAYKPQISVRSAVHSQPNVLMIFCPWAGRNLWFSPCLSTSVLRNIGGDGGMRWVRVDCVDGDDVDGVGCPTSRIVATVTIVTARAGCDSE